MATTNNINLNSSFSDIGYEDYGDIDHSARPATSHSSQASAAQPARLTREAEAKIRNFRRRQIARIRHSTLRRLGSELAV